MFDAATLAHEATSAGSSAFNAIPMSESHIARGVERIWISLTKSA